MNCPSLGRFIHKEITSPSLARKDCVYLSSRAIARRSPSGEYSEYPSLGRSAHAEITSPAIPHKREPLFVAAAGSYQRHSFGAKTIFNCDCPVAADEKPGKPSLPHFPATFPFRSMLQQKLHQFSSKIRKSSANAVCAAGRCREYHPGAS